MRIGLYGGTFDPFHNGHLALAIGVAEMRALDQVWFVPAAVSPFKMGHQQTPAIHRLEMVRRAIAPLPFFRVLELELHRAAPSYTIDTVEALIQADGQLGVSHDYALILGDDMMADFPKWHRVDELVGLAEVLVGRRGGHHPVPQHGSAPVREALRAGATSTPIMEMSGTEIRERLQRGQCCIHLLTQPVLQYIEEHSLYI